jgi:hypothetical protein
VLCTHGLRWFDSPGSPAHCVSQAGSLVPIRVLVADATFKRPREFVSESSVPPIVFPVMATPSFICTVEAEHLGYAILRTARQTFTYKLEFAVRFAQSFLRESAVADCTQGLYHRSLEHRILYDLSGSPKHIILG